MRAVAGVGDDFASHVRVVFAEGGYDGFEGVRVLGALDPEYGTAHACDGVVDVTAQIVFDRADFRKARAHGRPASARDGFLGEPLDPRRQRLHEQRRQAAVGDEAMDSVRLSMREQLRHDSTMKRSRRHSRKRKGRQIRSFCWDENIDVYWLPLQSGGIGHGVSPKRA